MKHASLYFLLLRFLIFSVVAIALSACGQQRDSSQLPAVKRDISANAKAYPDEIARARALGLPLSLRDLGESKPNGPADAAPIYKKLGHLLRAYPLSSRELALEGLSTAPMPTERALGYARQALVHRARYLQMIHEAAGQPVCRFAHDWNEQDPQHITFPEMATIREAALLLTGQSVLMAENGQSLAAVKNEALCFRLSDQIAGEKILAAYEVACDVDNTAFTCLQKILYISQGDPQVAQAVGVVIAQSWHPHSLAAALRNEAAFQQATVAFARQNGPQPFFATISPQMTKLGLDNKAFGSDSWNKLMDANAAVLLQETQEAIAVADKPYPVAHAQLKAIVADSMKPAP